MFSSGGRGATGAKIVALLRESQDFNHSDGAQGEQCTVSDMEFTCFRYLEKYHLRSRILQGGFFAAGFWREKRL